MKRAFFLAAAALALATAAPFAAFSQETAAPTEAVVGRPAPEIQVGEWIGGNGLTTLADLKGDVVFIEFWGTH